MITIEDIKNNNAEWLLGKLSKMDGTDAIKTMYRLSEQSKSAKYPRTVTKCSIYLADSHMDIVTNFSYKQEAINALQDLLLCRDAYWKFAGGWKPDYKVEETRYTIIEYLGRPTKSIDTLNKRILAFPTEEMRDAFYENFKDLIEKCKELL